MAAKRPEINTSDVQNPDSYTVKHTANQNTHDLDVSIDTMFDASVTDPYLAKLIEAEKNLRAFMEQEVTFTVHHSHDPNAVDPVPAGVNGEIRKFKRGETYTEKRMFLDSLIRVTRTTTPVVYMDSDGLYQTRYETKFSEAFPLSIIHDPAGDVGRRWLEHRRKNAW